MIKLLIAEDHYLIRQGIKRILEDQSDIRIVGEAQDTTELEKLALKEQPDVLMVDYTSDDFPKDALRPILKLVPRTKVLAVTPSQSKMTLQKGLDLQVTSFLLKNCEQEEIIEAIHATAENENFFCGQIIEQILQENPESDLASSEIMSRVYASCEPLRISNREVEIIRLIAQGYTTKEIADQLFLSTHTIVTHRKNIMRKLGINNTASLVIYAVQENIVKAN
jgi:DNA-binding NarL/FixJ family response regulator